MSKISYSKKINEIMKDKLSDVDNINPSDFFDNNELFLLASCITYLVLSKEETNNKSLNNTNVIMILDNFKEYFSHGLIDIDEDNKLINVKKVGVSFPFSLLIDYVKNDISVKEQTHESVISGLYLNNKLFNEKKFNTNEQIDKSIFYRVIAKSKTGNTFNINEVYQRVKSLFYQYSLKNYGEELLKYYESDSKTINESNNYDLNYLESFLYVKDLIETSLKREYPDINFKIEMDNGKYTIKNNQSSLKDYYDNYSVMCDDFNKSFDPIENGVIKYLSSLIECFERKNIINNESDDIYERMSVFASNFTGNYKTISNNEANEWFKRNYLLIETILINIYGLNTLVINNEEYLEFYKNEESSRFILNAKNKRPFMDFTTKRKELLTKLLERKIDLDRLLKQKENCEKNDKSDIVLDKIQPNIDLLLEEVKNINSELHDIIVDFNYKVSLPDSIVDSKELNDTIAEIYTYKSMFEETKSEESKKELVSILDNLYDKLNTYEVDNSFNRDIKMDEALSVIKNCLLHSSRVVINNKDDLIYFEDYDNGIKSGEVLISKDKYIELIDEVLNRSLNIER